MLFDKGVEVIFWKLNWWVFYCVAKYKRGINRQSNRDLWTCMYLFGDIRFITKLYI